MKFVAVVTDNGYSHVSMTLVTAERDNLSFYEENQKRNKKYTVITKMQ